MTDPAGWTVLGQVRATASAEVVGAADVQAQHEAGDHSNCGHDEETS